MLREIELHFWEETIEPIRSTVKAFAIELVGVLFFFFFFLGTGVGGYFRRTLMRRFFLFDLLI